MRQKRKGCGTMFIIAVSEPPTFKDVVCGKDNQYCYLCTEKIRGNLSHRRSL